MPASDKWQTVRLNIKSARTNPIYKVGQAGQFFWLHFMDLVPTSTIQLKNVRIEEDEVSPRPVTLEVSDKNIIEAEDFNASTTGSSFASRQLDRSKIASYINPVPGEFPIYAFTSAGYTMIEGADGAGTGKHRPSCCRKNTRICTRPVSISPRVPHGPV